MSFIGVICESKNENYIKQILTKKLNKETVIILNKDNVDNLKNIKFKTMIIFSNNNKILSKKELIKSIIQKSNYLIIDADKKINFDLLQDIKINVITYGFNSKSTITTSSVRDENILLCIQRNIQDLNNKEIEPQEISIQKSVAKIDTNILMGVATTLLLYGKSEIKL